MKTNNRSMYGIICLKLMWVLFILLSCNFFVNGQAAESYPNEINCVASEYITKFSDWREFTLSSIPGNTHPWHILIRLKILDHSQFISGRRFIIFGDRGRGIGNQLVVEIWKMVSPVDAKRLFDLCDRQQRPEYFEKPPRECFAFENFVIWVNTNISYTQFNVREELNKIINMCFE